MKRSRAVEVSNAQGMHARPSSAFVKLASRFAASITLSRSELQGDEPVGKRSPKDGLAASGRTAGDLAMEGLAVNGKSIMGVLMLAAGRGSRLTISAEGKDAEEAVDALADLVRRGFDE